MDSADALTTTTVLSALCCLITAKGKVSRSDVGAVSRTLSCMNVSHEDDSLMQQVHSTCKRMYAQGVDAAVSSLLPALRELSRKDIVLIVEEGIDRVLEVSAPAKAKEIAATLRDSLRNSEARKTSYVSATRDMTPRADASTGEVEPPTKTAAPETLPNQKLRRCPDCGGIVSKRAAQCPHCGSPLPPDLPDFAKAEVVAPGVVSTNIPPPLLLQLVHQVFLDYETIGIEIDTADLRVSGLSGPGASQVIEAVIRNEGGVWNVYFISAAPGFLTDWGRGRRDLKKLPELLLHLVGKLPKT